MPIAGIIGGIGPESTIDYYRRIIATYRTRRPDGTYPRLLVNSIDLSEAVKLVESQQYDRLTHLLRDELDRLKRAGAEFAVLAANTPHLVFDQLSKVTSLPLISIVEATCNAVKLSGVTKVGLFGTRFTMANDFYYRSFHREGISLVVPGDDEQALIHERYMGELVNGVFKNETKQELLTIAARMHNHDRIQGLILGGTELPLILRDVDELRIPLFDTAQIHVDSIVDRLLAGQS